MISEGLLDQLIQTVKAFCEILTRKDRLMESAQSERLANRPE